MRSAIKNLKAVVILGLFAFVVIGSFIKAPSEAPAKAMPPVEKPSTGVPIDAVHTVGRVIDGDTIELETREVVRLIGVDTPETKHPNKPVGCFGPEASDYLTKQLPRGTQVTLQADTSRADRYGRRLAYVYTSNDRMLNAELILEGYGYAKAYKPDTAHADEFAALEAQAKSAHKGVWSDKCTGGAK